MGLAAVLVVAGGVAALSAYEAHVINVTAHIENALYVHDKAISFGTVFPQEYLARPFTVELSESFKTSGRKDLVDYKIVQKAKCWNGNVEKPLYAPVNYWDDNCPIINDVQYVPMNDLCQFLSKLPVDGEIDDEGVPSYYYDDTVDFCRAPKSHIATGVLGGWYGETGLEYHDLIDQWAVDLKVPPVAGSVGQDWPETCKDYVVPTDGANYGCDLWVEVTNIGVPVVP